jgi:formamidopyrimidine-DNA glycosylase
MPELPEIVVHAKQMNKEITGRQIESVEIRQPRNLNMPVSEFMKLIKRKVVENVSSRGKWIFVKLRPDCFLLISLGMNGDLLFFSQEQKLPPKYHFKLRFSDGTGFTIGFQWFGYIHLVKRKDLSKHKFTGRLGVSPLEKEFTLSFFKKLLDAKKTGVKSFLLDQKNIAGIGNVYVQDTLYEARLHPNRKICSLSQEEKEHLYYAIKKVLNHGIKLGGLVYEKDFYGKHGKLTVGKFLVGYRTGKSCPNCGTAIEKIKTGSTSSYICPKCQRLR